MIIGIVFFKSFGNRLKPRLPELQMIADLKLFNAIPGTYMVYYLLQVCWSVPACSIVRASVLVCPYSLESCVTESLLGAIVQIGDRCYFDIRLYRTRYTNPFARYKGTSMTRTQIQIETSAISDTPF